MGVRRHGEPTAYAGTDFIVARDGRLAAVYMFFDPRGCLSGTLPRRVNRADRPGRRHDARRRAVRAQVPPKRPVKRTRAAEGSDSRSQPKIASCQQLGVGVRRN